MLIYRVMMKQSLEDSVFCVLYVEYNYSVSTEIPRTGQVSAMRSRFVLPSTIVHQFCDLQLALRYWARRLLLQSPLSMLIARRKCLQTATSIIVSTFLPRSSAGCHFRRCYSHVEPGGLLALRPSLLVEKLSNGFELFPRARRRFGVSALAMHEHRTLPKPGEE